MELELHVGPLTPFFLRALRVEAERHGEPAPPEADVRARIEEWRAWVGEGLVASGHLRSPPLWDEGAVVERHRLALDAVRALKLLIACGSPSGAPAELPDRPELDPRWVALAESGFAQTPYDQVLVPELWLPAAFAFTFRCPYPDGHEVEAGSVVTLLDQVALARDELLVGTPIDAALWAADTATTRDLRALARRALGTLEQAAGRAASRGQPLLLSPA